MNLLYVRALHIIFVVTWFSGMFYLCRLFIYNREAQDKPEPERSILQAQFGIMIQRLLFGITWPSAILTLLFGTWLLLQYNNLPVWLYLKLGLVLLLYGYNISLHVLYRQQRRGVFRYTSTGLRLWNEVPTVFLVGIVMLVVVQQNISLLYGILGLLGLSVALMGGIFAYRRMRG
ncbi:MAG: protoporphyrinogen IX oxidase [Bacteroidetes bacterium]|nr:protoporphyrinogen IX oxidase [Bacteroidota bacterium]